MLYLVGFLVYTILAYHLAVAVEGKQLSFPLLAGVFLFFLPALLIYIALQVIQTLYKFYTRPKE